MYCRKCGRKVNEDWNICPYCKTAIEKNVKYVKGRKTIKTRKSKTLHNRFKIVAVFILLFLVGNIVKNTVLKKENVIENQENIESESTDIKENGKYVSFENANVVKDEENGRKFIDVLVPGTYWKTDLTENVHGFTDISYIDGNYYLSMMVDDRDVTVGMRWYDKVMILTDLPIDVSNIKSTGEAYCYNDEGSIIFIISSYQDGGRIRIEQTDEGAEFVRRALTAYGSSYREAFNGTMYKVIADEQNHQVSALENPEDMWKMVTCYLGEGDYKESYEYMRDENGNITQIGDNTITTTCSIYYDYDEEKMKLNMEIWGDEVNSEGEFIDGAELDFSRLYTDGEVEVLDPETGKSIANMTTYIKAFRLNFYEDEYKGISTTEFTNKYVK